jgi:flagellin-like protein
MENMKNQAVSPVIATVLLVVIAISVSLSAILWYNNIQESTTQEMGGKINYEIAKMYGGIRIVSATTVGYTIRNTGSVTLYDLRVYDKSTLKDTYSSLEPNAEISKSTSLTQGNTLYVTAKYADDKYVIAAAPIQNVGASIAAGGIFSVGNVTGESTTTYGLPAGSDLTVVN